MPAPRPPVLFGRDDALARLAAAVRPGTITAVAGLPGVGKTTLVATLAGGWAEVVWVDTSRAVTPADLWAALGAALGITLQRPEDGYAQVTAALGAREAPLVVLDAAEPLDAAAWDEVARLDRDLPRVAWVVTSVVRPPAGMGVLELGPLEPDAAAALLVARARQRCLDQPPREDDPVWRALAERLDGLPLAMELAAGRFGVLTAAQILDRLDRPGLLAGGRHGTLSGALRYAWSLLGEADRAALAACCVFRGGFDLAAAEAVLGEEAVDRLAKLRERSALAWRDGRFHVLDGLRRLAEAEGAAVLAEAAVRHREYFARHGLALREGARGADPAAASAGLLLEQENLVAAFASARPVDPTMAAEIALGLLYGLWTHGPLWRADVLGDLPALARAVAPVLGSDLLVSGGEVARFRGDEAGARAMFDLAVGLAEGAGAPGALCYALAARADHHRARGEDAEARALLARADTVGAGSPEHVQALMVRGRLERLAGRREEAAEAYLGVLAIAGGNAGMRAAVLANLANVRGEQRRHVEARAYLEEAIALTANTRSIHFESHANSAALALIQRDVARADAHLAACRALGAWPEVEGIVSLIEALRHWAAGDAEATGAALARSLGCMEGQDPAGAARVRLWLAVHGAEADASAAIAGARAAGAHPAVVDVLEAAALGLPLPPAPAEEVAEAQIARALFAGAPAPAWKFDGDGRWFERPGGRVDLARRGAMRRILAALVTARRERPGEGLSVDALFAAGWPGESALPEAASARVYTAVRELRSLGLEPVLRRHAEGYLLDPAVAFAFGG